MASENGAFVPPVWVPAVSVNSREVIAERTRKPLFPSVRNPVALFVQGSGWVGGCV